jgi:ADP-ribose pyrophosphatase
VKPDESRTVYEGSLVDLVVERWGDRVREIVKHRGAVAIVAVDRERRLWLVRQRREAVRKDLLELPAGLVESGEEPLASAKRELKEECGLEGGKWRELGAFYTSPGFADERIVVFAAEELEPGLPDPDEDEEVHVELRSVDEIDALISELEDAKTIAGLLLYLRASR